MGRVTFEPALAATRWPWPNLDVFVLGSQRPEVTPDHVVVDSDPERLYFLGAGKRLTDGLSLDTRLRLERERPVSDGAVEIVYAAT